MTTQSAVEVSDVANQDAPKAEKAERGRSRIEWPYFSLDEAYKLARGVFDLGGNCQIDQLAGYLDQAASGGGFRLKVQAARTFGLINSTQGNLSLTDLGLDIIEPDREREARATAFLKVPLYSAIYENFKGKTLPGTAGLEGAMVNLGVAIKQKDKARQAFQRSAKEAGFFAYGATKLVYPVFTGEKNIRDPKVSIVDEGLGQKAKPPADRDSEWSSSDEELDPFIRGLLKKLPKPETSWPLDGRRKWLQSAVSIFDLIYEGSDDGQSISIIVNRSSAN